MLNLPDYIGIIFGLTTLLTIGGFYMATNNSRMTLIVLLTWLVIQSLIGISGFYTTTDTIPPRFLLLILPPVTVIIVLFTTSKGREFIDSLDIKILTILHTVRIPVEVVLFWLFLYEAVPELMTFGGRNFDILAGLTAPLIFYFGFLRSKLNRKIILLWNLICLGLLINIVVNGVLSAPLPFQKFAFEQPNIAVLSFPFNLLPSCIVPLILFSHLAAIRQLLKGKPDRAGNR